MKKIRTKPKFVIADTIKGKGISIMEHTNVMKKNRYYGWHSGAPKDEIFIESQNELIKQIKLISKRNNFDLPALKNISTHKKLKAKIFEVH